MTGKGVLLWAVGVVAAGMSAASAQSQARFVPEPRSGIWGSRAVIDGKERRLLLTLTVMRTTDEAGAARLTFQGRMLALGEPNSFACNIEVAMAAPGDPSDLSADCKGSVPGGADRLALHFGPEGQTIAGTWWRQNKPVKLRLARPSQDPTTRLVGDWIADAGFGKKCVLHVYRNEYNPSPAEFEDLNPEHIASTLDRYAIDGSSGHFGLTRTGPCGRGGQQLCFTDEGDHLNVLELDARTQRLVFVISSGSPCGAFTRVQQMQTR